MGSLSYVPVATLHHAPPLPVFVPLLPHHIYILIRRCCNMAAVAA
jgi:hypothetical protein